MIYQTATRQIACKDLRQIICQTTGQADPRCGENHTDYRGFARAVAHRRTDGRASLHSPPFAKGLRRNEAGGLDVVQHAQMELARPLGIGLRLPFHPEFPDVIHGAPLTHEHSLPIHDKSPTEPSVPGLPANREGSQQNRSTPAVRSRWPVFELVRSLQNTNGITGS
jgi:hypothetical protein